MSKEFDNVLDECLERLLVKGETIEQCLQSYPEQAVNLKPLLQTGLAARQAVAIQPRPDFKAQARYQFHSALQEVVSRGRRPFFNWLPRWATVVAIVLGVLMMGGGTIVAASYSMPDTPLYSVKLATEQAQLALTPSDIGKAKLCAKFADRRVAEIIYMANKGDAQQVEVITERLDERLVMLTRLTSISAPEAVEAPKALLTTPVPSEEAGNDKGVRAKADSRDKLRTTVANYAINHPAVLRAALEKAPESAKSALRRAIAVSEAGYERALKGLD